MRAPLRAVLCACALALLPAAAPKEPSRANPKAAAAAPEGSLTIDQVRYRAAEKKLSTAGDLIITPKSLVFAKDKTQIRIPFEKIHVVSLGKLRGDVDTDWVVVATGDARNLEKHGFRDGKAMGYGGRTPEIHARVIEAVAAASAAQYAVPQGFETFDEFDDQFTIGAPRGWDVYLPSLLFVGERSPWGIIVFSAEPVRVGAAGSAETPAIPEDVLEAPAGAFFVERTQARSGMSCKGFSDKARQALLVRTAEGSLPWGCAVEQALEVTPLPIEGCQGLHVLRRCRTPEAREVVQDFYAVARADTLLIVALRAAAERHEVQRATLEAAVATLRLSAARWTAPKGGY
jgi:hypothetical protein